ncbi:Protein tyrosine and serine/threonine kinase [Pelomyxa schiedti]|nr:Protein tyrosine and serine/threonine kinase [Pelomyxa schiedti]
MPRFYMISYPSKIFFQQGLDTVASMNGLTDDNYNSLGVNLGERGKIRTYVTLCLNQQQQVTKTISAETSVLTDVVPESLLGSGNFGKVICYHFSRPSISHSKIATPVAMKELHDSDLYRELSREVDLLAALRHPNIVSFYGIAVFNEKQYIVTELAEGSVDQLIKKFHPSSEVLAKIAKDACSGMEYLSTHQPPIIHRDLACRNVLYKFEDKSICAKIADILYFLRQ